MKVLELHEVKDQNKFIELKKSLQKNGYIGKPILTIDCGDYLQAITGSHRIAVCKELEIDFPYIVINIDDIFKNENISIKDIKYNLDYTYTLLKEYGYKKESEILLDDL